MENQKYNNIQQEQPALEPAHPEQGTDVEPAPVASEQSNEQPDSVVTDNEAIEAEQPLEPAHPEQGADVEPAPTAPLGTEISDEGVIVHNPAFNDSQSETIVEVQSQPKELAETSTDISPEAVVGGAALALGAAAIAAKRLITRKQR